MENDKTNVGRRRFTNWLLGTSLGALFAAVAYPLARFISPPRVPEPAVNQIEAGPTNDPELVERGFKILRFGVEPVILLRVSETDYRAFTATCTHLDCIVEYRKKDKIILCNCHDGIYDLKGQNVAGPPPQPLAPYEVNVVAQGAGKPGTIVVSRS
ncbi:MAG: ubiquinol-cytochrome c reductase iron-sulfur subunit [bacterium]|nr:ubiquinol-cytochrome c reductase iron-sulfur subunit [bacterium]